MIRLIDHIIALPESDLVSVAVQDAALCRLWLEDRDGGQKGGRRAESAAERIGAWLKVACGDSPQTEGRRHQTLLRELIGQVQDARIGSMARDEIDLLYHVYDLIAHSVHAETFQRVHEFLHPHIITVQQRREVLEEAPGLPTLNRKLRIVDSRDLMAAERKSVTGLAGIEGSFRGPVLTHEGHVRVMGDVPAEATIVVESGHVVVDGYVLGRIAASGQCEVKENISGLIVVRDGDVRARALIDNAVVVSKHGSVFCRKAQNPKLVFAGNRIDVQGETTLGRYLAPHIEIHESAHGGEFHVSSDLKAPHFRHAPTGSMTIVFRTRLTCRDYGESPSREMAKALSASYRLRRRVHHTKRITFVSAREAEEFASSALLYLLGGEKVKRLLDETMTARRRLDVLNRIILSVSDLYVRNSSARNDDGSGARYAQEPPQELAGPLEGSDGADADLIEARNQISAALSDLASSRGEMSREPLLFVSLHDKTSGWLEEADDLEARIRSNEELIEETVGWKNIRAKDGSRVMKLGALRQVMAAARDRPPEDPLAKRLQSPFVKNMLRLVRNRVDSAKRARTIYQEVRLEFLKSKDEVWRTYNVRIEEDEDEDTKDMSCTGRYDPDVTFYADPSLLGQGHEASKGQVMASRGEDAVLTYRCRAGTISQVR